ncbi:MAG TPA: ribonuclease P protein component [Halothiobacillus sp.]|nr:ribonuclease P protein component [Halothiobacillus sp.]
MVDARFGRDRRLRSQDEFKQVFDARQRVGQSGLTFLYRPNELGRPRLGLAIAKKQIRRAHERNRIKRIAREVFRVRAQFLPPVDLVLMARTEVEKLDNDRLRENLDKMLDRVVQRFSADQSANKAENTRV